MCISSFRTVRSVEDNRARMDDGRTVRLGPLKGIKKGDRLEVYADVAVAKVPAQEFKMGRKS